MAATFLEHKLSLFAPIVYNQSIIDYFSNIELGSRRELLMPMNINFLLKSKAMILLKLEGWDRSWGIKKYIKMCEVEKIKVYEFNEKDFDHELLSLLNELKESFAQIC